MPVSAKQLNFCDISSAFDKFHNQNQNNLLSLLEKFMSAYASISILHLYLNFFNYFAIAT